MTETPIYQSGDGIKHYYSAVSELQAKIIATQMPALQRLAVAMADSVSSKGRIFVFGSGHSHIMAEEAFYRAGGIAAATPLLSGAFLLHENPALGSRIERQHGLAPSIFEPYQPKAGEVLLVYSNSGVNPLPVELAQEARSRGLYVAGICSLAYSHQAPMNALGLRLEDVVDVCIDNHGVPGDALLPLAGTPWRVCASSTITGALIWNCLLAEMTALLLAKGIQPPVFVSYNLPGALQHNASILETWRPINRHL